MILEKLTLNNMDDLKKFYIYSSNFESYDKDFIKEYENQNFIVKYLYRKCMKIIKYKFTIIGYIWCDTALDRVVNVWALYLDPTYLNYIDINTLSIFNNYLLSYEAIDNYKNGIMLKKFGFEKVKPSILMEMNLTSYMNTVDIERLNKEFQEKISKLNNKLSYSRNFKFSCKPFVIDQDEEIRCRVQNEIFSEWNRRPLDVDDIINDINQEYYLNDLCFFGKLNDNYVGYGQIIFSRDMYTVVNFGISKDFRGYGIGKMLLYNIIISAIDNGIDKLFIRVDANNQIAKNLYMSMGFIDKHIITRWERNIYQSNDLN